MCSYHLNKCEWILEKGPHRAKKKLKVLLETPHRVNPVKKYFIVRQRITLFLLYDKHLKSNRYRESAATAPTSRVLPFFFSPANTH